ncbi:substrate-binding domain-containing protein (plasmid) [Sinorhizobium numidicum]|uniref:Substrate-binding domain-containing protein n=1 Tax=Sinorhizobium numidicum TaxID=680248 RepID=A0ABY8D3I6_9HYPH|nr:substrate-binding domain-containing protein [Sinorhizobium numidicum]WEX79603.1 substrate-binding domain-containing protein [Sinorhizobium numidicum]WEX85441.1 substrate-binding domain-containing protein [Sinorhizobium numidicum]
MTRRVTMNELIKVTGLSRATIDRALNKRGGIHPRTEQVINRALEQLGRAPQENGGLPASSAADAVLRVGRGFAMQIQASCQNRAIPLNFVDMSQKNEDEMLDAVNDACRDVSRPLIVTAKNTERMNALLLQARKRGKRVITFVSDLPHDSRDAFVGIDNRSAGQTAAYLIGSLLKERESATVGVVLGDYAFNNHEDREIGFRSHLRANFPNIRLTDVAKGEDSPEQTYLAVRDLLKKHPDVAAIYNVAGGNAGMAKALEEAGLAGRTRVVTHEANSITVPLMRDDVVQYVLAQDPAEMLKLAVNVALAKRPQPLKEQHLVDFGLHTRFNLPRFALDIVD